MLLQKTEVRGGKAGVGLGVWRLLNVDGVAVKVMTASSRGVLAHG